ncbi:MAG: carbohydrate kinase [Terriglobales bacterium]
MKVISIGEVLWDVIGGKEHLGGAPFNFAAHLLRLEHDVFFVSAVGADDRGKRILHRMEKMGLSTRFVREDPEHGTGIVSVTLSGGGQPHFVLHRPAAYDFPQLTDEDYDFLLSQSLDWIYFGTLLQMSSIAWELTKEILATVPTARRFYDVNLRANSYTPELLRELMQLATVMKLNDVEVEEISKMLGTPFSSLEQFCRQYAADFNLEAVCVTRGSKGCALLHGDEYVESPGYQIKVADTVGAGDAFAAGLLHGIGNEWPAEKIADFANRVGALVASRAGAIPAWTLDEVAAFDPQSYRLERA